VQLGVQNKVEVAQVAGVIVVLCAIIFLFQQWKWS